MEIPKAPLILGAWHERNQLQEDSGILFSSP